MTATATRTRPNTYAGQCSNCGQSVAAQAGALGGKVNGRWTVHHTDCPTAAARHMSNRDNAQDAWTAQDAWNAQQSRRTARNLSSQVCDED